jgi:LmbE family N-acetylglucosaminyl deacetylase
MTAGIAVIVLAAVAAAWLARMRRYRAWLRLPPNRSDVVSLRGGDHAMPLSLEPDGFDVPHGLDLLGRTVLLQLTVKAAPLGRVMDPFIEIRDADRAYRQYFERGAAGQRYLNLAPLFQCGAPKQAVRVGLHGSSIRWESKAALLAFDSPAIEGAKVLVLAPHPDDAEIAAFGLYADSQSWVVTVTAGEQATKQLPAEIPEHARSHWAAWLRVWDCLSVPHLGNVPPQRRVSLAYPDGAIESMYREPARPVRLACETSLPRRELRARNLIPQFQHGTPDCTWVGLVEELRVLLELTQPDIVVCPHPLLDSHPDHIFTAIALESALRDFRGKPPNLFLYVVHGRGSPVYPLGPAESLVCLSPGRCAGWAGDSLYSHPLEPQRRQAKYFAIEAMHAARSYAADVDPKSSGKILKDVLGEISAYLSGMELNPASLLRRAPRPNEIYYVVRGETLSDLTEQMFATAAVSCP